MVRLREASSWGGRQGRRGGYETFAPDSPSLTSSFRDVTSTASLPTLDLVVGHRPGWTCAGNCALFKEAEAGLESGLQPLKIQEAQRGGRQTLKSTREGRDAKQHSTEVWI